MAETHQLRTNDLLPTTKAFQRLNEEAERAAKLCSAASMPSLDHLKMSDYQLVYEPSDDTYLMLDALAWDFDESDVNKKNDSDSIKNKVMTTLEIGCGTGVSTIFLAKLLQQQWTSVKDKKRMHIVTDINKDAIRITNETAQRNSIDSATIKTHLCDLATPLLQTHNRQIDVLIFNPPYVPTPDDEVGSNGIEASWAGGAHGRIVIDRALGQISSLLSKPDGVAYMITVDDNKPEEIASIMMAQYGILVKPYLRRRACNEFLTVLKMTFIS